MTIVKAAAVQISPVLYSREGTLQRVVQKIAELGKLGVQFATFPETVVPYYPYFSFVQTPFEIRTGKEHLRLLDQAVTVPSATTQALGEAARQARMVVSIGVNERDGGTLYNTQLLFDADGTLIQRRRKISPTFHERMIWGQGDGSGLRAVDSAVGRIGQLACWEHYNPWRATPRWRTASKSIRRCIPVHSRVTDLPSRHKSISVNTPLKPAVSSSTQRRGWMANSKPRS